eukprot:c19529_g1_i1.p3 GENE.c19529_g1_i1~~c19529_g1_i1.p3  ORF type:complete len:120 (-),score=7.86 c19529_g1_i1:1966-2325(-)
MRYTTATPTRTTKASKAPVTIDAAKTTLDEVCSLIDLLGFFTKFNFGVNGFFSERECDRDLVCFEVDLLCFDDDFDLDLLFFEVDFDFVFPRESDFEFDLVKGTQDAVGELQTVAVHVC